MTQVYRFAMNRIWDERQQRFRQYLKDIRKESGLSQEELAKRLDRPQSYVSKYERGERKLDFVETVEICEALGHYDIKEVYEYIKK